MEKMEKCECGDPGIIKRNYESFCSICYDEVYQECAECDEEFLRNKMRLNDDYHLWICDNCWIDDK